MRHFKAKLLVGAAIGGIMSWAAAGQANATTVNGVTFSSGADFAVSSFYQNAPTQVGQTLTAVGRIDEINNATGFCNNCELDFYARNFTATQVQTDSHGNIVGIGFIGGQVTLYTNAPGAFNPNAGSIAAAVATVTGGTDWLDLSGHIHAVSTPGISGNFTLDATGTLSGPNQNAFGDSQLDVTAGPGAADAYFHTQTIADGLGSFADLLLTSSADNRVVPPGFSFAGSADVRGVSTTPVPEPATAALFGTSLLAIGLLRRRQKHDTSL